MKIIDTVLQTVILVTTDDEEEPDYIRFADGSWLYRNGLSWERPGWPDDLEDMLRKYLARLQFGSVVVENVDEPPDQ